MGAGGGASSGGGNKPVAPASNTEARKPISVAQALKNISDKEIMREYIKDAANNRTYAGYLSKATGGDAIPTMVGADEFDRMSKNGEFKLVAYRAVEDVAHAKQFALGKVSHDGTGVYGNGHYFEGSSPSRRSESLKEAKVWGDTIMTIGIRKGTKIAVYSDLVKELKGSTTSGGGVNHKELTKLAFKKGYDGYRVDLGGNVEHLVLLNRKAAVVKNEIQTKKGNKKYR